MYDGPLTGYYFGSSEALFAMMEKEEAFILAGAVPRRIMIDLYETKLTSTVVARFIAHINNLAPNVHRLAISAPKRNLIRLRRVMLKAGKIGAGRVFYSPDMEAAKIWLVH